MTKIFLFTNSFPYNDQYTEISFLKNEVPVLSEKFILYLVPGKNKGIKTDINSNIIILDTLANLLIINRQKNIFITAIEVLQYKYLYKELFSCKSLKQIYNLFYTTSAILLVYKWAKRTKALFDSDTILYTYWNTYITLGLQYFREKEKITLKIVSRAHGADLYLERTKFNPYYELRLKNLDSLFLASKAAKNYLTEKFPAYKEKYKLAYLGTKAYSICNQIKTDENIFQIVSCSTINEIKRVDRIYEVMYLLAQKNPGKSFQWTHLGGGPLEKMIQSKIEQNKLVNFLPTITGVIPQEKIHDFYKENFVDCFVHTSSTEGGICIAIVEAQSYGIPVVSTCVGGIPEVISADTGILVDPYFKNQQITEAIEKIIFDFPLRIELGQNSYKNWLLHFSAEKNFTAFGDILLQL